MRDSGVLDVGLALTGGAPPDRALVLLQWFVWTLLLDDRVDDGQWAGDGVLTEFAKAAAGVLNGDRQSHQDPMLRVLAEDLWPRTRDLVGPDRQAAFAEHIARYLAAQCEVVDRRADSVPVALDNYIPLRVELFGADILFDLIEVIHLLDVDDAGVVRRCAGNVLGWVNDIYSLEKDLLLGEEANLVRVLHDERGCSWQEAVDTAAAMIYDQVEEFRRHGEPVALASRLATAMVDVLVWHQKSSRYHWRDRDRGAVDTSLTPLSLIWAEFERDPYPVYERLREDFPVMRDEPLDAWVLSRYRDVRTALCDSRFSSANYNWQSGPVVGRILLEMSDSEHTAHRALMSPAFRGRAMNSLSEKAFDLAKSLAVRTSGRIRRTGDADLVSVF
ncbi:terpene synthase family protein, partial [Lentzea jiangxiensis]